MIARGVWHLFREIAPGYADAFDPRRGPRYDPRMASSKSDTERLLRDVLELPERERVRIATEVLASLDGPPDADWDAAWAAELTRRERAAALRGTPGAEWSEVRARILARLGKE
jgi:hypothetical protein